MTRCPAPTPVTPSPTASTTPDASTPGISGGRPARWYTPARTSASARFTPAAATRTSTWPGPATGSGTSTGTSTSGPPNSSIRTARIPHLLSRDIGHTGAPRAGQACTVTPVEVVSLCDTL